LHLNDSKASDGLIEQESNDEEKHGGDALEIMDLDEEDLVKLHSKLSARGIIDLTIS
jgi:hypothetical protein